MSSSSLQLHHHYVQTDSTATECAVLLLISLYSFLSLLQASECYLWLADQGLECSAANDRAAAFDSPFIPRLLLLPPPPPPPPIHSFNCNLLFTLLTIFIIANSILIISLYFPVLIVLCVVLRGLPSLPPLPETQPSSLSRSLSLAELPLLPLNSPPRDLSPSLLLLPPNNLLSYLVSHRISFFISRFFIFCQA